MKKLILWCGFLFASSINIGQASDVGTFYACESTYALCTTAICTPQAGNEKTLNCRCDVKKGYSASNKPCQGIKETRQGTQIFSRYFPVHGYRVCKNNRPWAWCLDKPCLTDSKDSTKANCACTQVDNLGNYVAVTDNHSNLSCESDVISSATVEQITQITDFLKTQKSLQPYTMEITK